MARRRFGRYPVGALPSAVLFFTYEQTDPQRKSTAGERSTASWFVPAAFARVVAGVVVVGEVDAIGVDVSATQLLGGLTGVLAGAWVVEWLLPALRERVD